MGFGDFFEEIVELEVMEDLLACGRCRGRCGCSGRNAMGELMELEIIEEIIDGNNGFGGW
jgi:hypothetical protein